MNDTLNRLIRPDCEGEQPALGKYAKEDLHG